MKGAGRRERETYRLALFAAWQVERFARERPLYGVARYLSELEPKDPQQAALETFNFVRRLKAQAERQAAVDV